MQEKLYFFFFFSSRRRHTRLTCDWSSDVCSSDLERVLLAMTLVGAAALAGSAAAFFAGSRLLVFAFAALLGLATTLIRPALQALLPSLARTPEELIAANGATSTIESLGTLVGPLVAGVLVSVGNVWLVFAVGAVTLLGGAALFARVRVDSRIDL